MDAVTQSKAKSGKGKTGGKNGRVPATPTTTASPSSTWRRSGLC
jgi:hypothetical protein